MKWFNNRKIGTKMLIGFILVALFSGVVGYIGMTSINSINAASESLYKDKTVPMSKISELSTLFQRARVNTRDIVIANTPEEIEEYTQILQEIRNKFSKVVEEYEKFNMSSDVKSSFERLKNARVGYGAHLDKLTELAKANKDEQAIALLKGDMRVTADAEMAEIDSIVSLINKEAEQLEGQNIKRAAAAYLQMSIFMLACLILSIGIGILLSRVISRQIGRLITTAKIIANGDLSASVEIDTHDEIGMLAKVFNSISFNINRIMSDISIAAENVASGSRQVSESSLALSQGATEQASSVEELTASLEEISSQTKSNADNARLANELAENARVNAAQGNVQMNEMLKAMDEINDSSNNISKIIKVIDEIAFQTNILALNAAVEAARAGQHGKGFAVVAEEVRNLAARSANAAKETTDMIEGSIKKVEGGTKIANQTAEALNKIVNEVTKVANLVGSIATASNEQAIGIGQVNQGIMQVSTVIQTNSATSEESAAASQELSKQAEKLKKLLLGFKLRKVSNAQEHTGKQSSYPEDQKKKANIEKKSDYNADTQQNFASAASTKKIALSDREFGKY